MIRALVIAFALMLAQPSTAQAVTGERVVGYVSDCAAALNTGELGPFDDLNVETEVTSETTIIRGWRSDVHPGLVVSLMRRTSETGRLGMCDVAFSPADDTGLMQQVAGAAREFLDTLRSNPNSAIDPSSMGNAIMTCIGGQAVSVFIDEGNLESGFNAQVALVSRAKMKCDG